MSIRLALLVLAVLLAGCGKKASPTAPGPNNEIIYPKAYPDPARSLD